MHKQFIFNFTCLVALMLPLIGHTAIYKHVDENGQVTYSNVKIRGGKKIDLEPADTSFGTKKNSEPSSKASSKEAAPKGFPKVDTDTQKKRDSDRKKILRAELESERQALAAAKRAYDEGAKNPETFRTANGGIRRNVAKYQEKMKKLQADVDIHQRNVDLLEQEISN